MEIDIRQELKRDYPSLTQNDVENFWNMFQGVPFFYDALVKLQGPRIVEVTQQFGVFPVDVMKVVRTILRKDTSNGFSAVPANPTVSATSASRQMFYTAMAVGNEKAVSTFANIVKMRGFNPAGTNYAEHFYEALLSGHEYAARMAIQIVGMPPRLESANMWKHAVTVQNLRDLVTKGPEHRARVLQSLIRWRVPVRVDNWARVYQGTQQFILEDFVASAVLQNALPAAPLRLSESRLTLKNNDASRVSIGSRRQEQGLLVSKDLVRAAGPAAVHDGLRRSIKMPIDDVALMQANVPWCVVRESIETNLVDYTQPGLLDGQRRGEYTIDLLKNIVLMAGMRPTAQHITYMQGLLSIGAALSPARAAQILKKTPLDGTVNLYTKIAEAAIDGPENSMFATFPRQQLNSSVGAIGKMMNYFMQPD